SVTRRRPRDSRSRLASCLARRRTLRPGRSMVVPIFRRGLLAAAQARPTTGSSTGPVSTSESQSESNPNSSRPVTSSAIASMDGLAPAAPTPMRIFMAGSILPRPRRPWRIVLAVHVHLVDGTYELFRYFLSPAAAFDRGGSKELLGVRGVVGSILGM